MPSPSGTACAIDTHAPLHRNLPPPRRHPHRRPTNAANPSTARRLPLIVERVKATLEFGGEGAHVSSHAGTASRTPPMSPSATNPTPRMTAAPTAGRRPPHRGSRRAGRSSRSPSPPISDGAFCVFLPGYLTTDKQPLPMMLQKRDGGYPYSATDLAALYFRVQENKATPEEQKPLDRDWHADRVVYLTDARQSHHFAMLFDAFRAAQWDHNPPPATTSPWNTPPSAPSSAKTANPSRPAAATPSNSRTCCSKPSNAPARRRSRARRRTLRRTDAPPSTVPWASAPSNTPTCARTAPPTTSSTGTACSRWRATPARTCRCSTRASAASTARANITPEQVLAARPQLLLDHPDEAALAKKLLQFAGVVESVARDLKPHYLCTYLYELCGAFSRFFENCSGAQGPHRSHQNEPPAPVRHGRRRPPPRACTICWASKCSKKCETTRRPMPDQPPPPPLDYRGPPPLPPGKNSWQQVLSRILGGFIFATASVSLGTWLDLNTHFRYFRLIVPAAVLAADFCEHQVPPLRLRHRFRPGAFRHRRGDLHPAEHHLRRRRWLPLNPARSRHGRKKHERPPLARQASKSTPMLFKIKRPAKPA